MTRARSTGGRSATRRSSCCASTWRSTRRTRPATRWRAAVPGRGPGRARASPSETAESAPGRANLVARLRGDGSLGGIVLHHHIDVVYADRRYWTVDPFGGVDQGRLPLRARRARHEVDRHPAAGRAAGASSAPGCRSSAISIFLATADEEAGSALRRPFVADGTATGSPAPSTRSPSWPASSTHAGYRAPLGGIVISEKTGLPLKLTARSEPGHGSMPWPDTAPQPAGPRARPPARGRAAACACCPRCTNTSAGWPTCCRGARARGYDDLDRSLGIPAFRARFLADRYRAATVRTTFAVNMLRGSEKLNVIPPEAWPTSTAACWPATIPRRSCAGCAA